MSWIAFNSMRNNAEENLLRQMTSLTEQIEVNINTADRTAKANAVLFSGSGLLKSFLFTPEEDRYYFTLLPLVRLFASYHNAYPDYEEIRVILADGREAARFSAMNTAHDVSGIAQQAWFRSMNETEASTMSFFQWNPDSGEPTMVIAHRLMFVDPTFEDSTAIPPSHRGYLVITMRLDSVRKLIEGTRIGKNGGILVLDPSGKLLYSQVQRVTIAESQTLLERIQSAPDKSGVFSYTVGKSTLLAQARALPGGLTLIGYLPENELEQAGQALGRIVLVIGSFAVLLATVLLILVLHGVIVKPLAQLGVGAEAIGSGKLETRLHVHGHDEVSQLAEQFNSMAESLVESRALRDEAQAEALRLKEESIESLRAADRLKDEFLANTSHELRTPLHGIVGLAESMLKGIAGPMAGVAQENLNLIIASGRRLTNLVNDILDFSKLKHKALKLALRPVDLKSSCDLVLSMVAVMAKPKGLELHNNIDEHTPLVMADENRLHQILYNLVGNAVKFTSEGYIAVSAHEDGDFIRIDVEDTGIGIPDDQKETIFRSFEQLDRGLERAGSGTGLGLAIARQLVNSHGGEIVVRDRDGSGSVFSFTIPRAPQGVRREDDGHVAPPVSSQGTATQIAIHNIPAVDVGIALPDVHDLGEQPDLMDFASKRDDGCILVVDDEPVNLRVIENYLRLNGYCVLTATSGHDALALLETQNDAIQLLLIDVMMPGQNGYQVCKEIRKRFSNTQLPVVFLTALTRDGDLEQGFAAGGNDYIPKPFSYAELMARIRLHLALSRQNQELHMLNIELERRVQERTRALQWAYDDMERLAHLDGLTGIHNRRMLDMALDDAWNKSTENNSPLCYVLMDIDYFKLFNDTYGHQAGDSCLRTLAQTISEIATQYDAFLGRYGGEEFALILEEPLQQAEHMAAAVLAAVQSIALPHSASSRGVVTLSAGIAERNSSIETRQDLIAKADMALYHAKERGRNQVVSFDAEDV